MDQVKYLTPDNVVDLHDDIVRRMGDPYTPLLHPDKLESAVSRPRNAAHYEQADLIRQAVILAVGISQSQACLDCNKRAAFAAADIFLRINGMVFEGDPLEVAVRLESVAESVDGVTREATTDQFEAWVRQQMTPVKGGS